MHQMSRPVSAPLSVPAAATQLACELPTYGKQHLPMWHRTQQQSHQFGADAGSTLVSEYAETQSTDASSSHRSTQAEVQAAHASILPSPAQAQTAGLPQVPEGSLKVLIVDGLLAGLANTKAWSAADREAFELCLHWSHEFLTAWIDNGTRQHQTSMPCTTVLCWNLMRPYVSYLSS